MSGKWFYDGGACTVAFGLLNLVALCWVALFDGIKDVNSIPLVGFIILLVLMTLAGYGHLQNAKKNKSHSGD